MSAFPETSTTLLARLAERETGIDQAAWRIFFERYQPVMVEYARMKCSCTVKKQATENNR